MGKSNSKPDKPSIEQSGVIAGEKNYISETYIESISVGEICGIIATIGVTIILLVGVLWLCWKKINKNVNRRIEREIARSCELLNIAQGTTRNP